MTTFWHSQKQLQLVSWLIAKETTRKIQQIFTDTIDELKHTRQPPVEQIRVAKKPSSNRKTQIDTPADETHLDTTPLLSTITKESFVVEVEVIQVKWKKKEIVVVTVHRSKCTVQLKTNCCCSASVALTFLTCRQALLLSSLSPSSALPGDLTSVLLGEHHSRKPNSTA